MYLAFYHLCYLYILMSKTLIHSLHSTVAADIKQLKNNFIFIVSRKFLMWQNNRIQYNLFCSQIHSGACDQIYNYVKLSYNKKKILFTLYTYQVS